MTLLEEIVERTRLNEAFSQATPGLQIFWDSTSAGALKFCPRSYLLSIVLGWQSTRQSVHLRFGILVHSGVELYHRQRAEGAGHEEALAAAVKWALGATWNSRLNRAEVLEHPGKNRLGLLRVLVWYLDRWQDDPLKTLHFEDGRPMVEVNFKMPLSLQSSEGEEFFLCGYFDRLAELNGEVYVPDVKTTAHSLDQRFFSQFTPDGQMSGYTLASRVVLEKEAQGIILDGCQVGATFARFSRQLISRSQEQLDEWLEDLRWWLRQAEEYAEALYWPMNDRNCWNCDFQSVCSRAPAARGAWLEANFVRRTWDPTKARGDV